MGLPIIRQAGSGDASIAAVQRIVDSEAACLN
jgi:hypothetical protein